MTSPKRFIAGAVCPRCAEMDKIMMFTDDQGEQVRECVACGFTDAMSDQEQPAAPEIETRVNKRDNKDDHTVNRWCFSSPVQKTDPPACLAVFGRRQTEGVAGASEHHGGQPAEGQQWQVVVQERGHHGVPDVVVLAIHIQAGGGAKGGV